MDQNGEMKLKSIILKGFKSIKEMRQPIEFGDISVLLGANGAGKSNLVSFFSMLNYMTTGSLQTYIGEGGGSQSILHYGPKTTPVIHADIHFSNQQDMDSYEFSLAHAAGDSLIFTHERITWQKIGNNKPYELEFAPGGKESALFKTSKEAKSSTARKTAGFIYNLLRNCQVFQFHDTSKNARIRNKVYIEDNRFLYSDAGNLAAFLYKLKNDEESKKYYDRIVRYIRHIMPQFKDFELEPSALNRQYIMLNWREKRADYLFGPHQISDGSLRFVALATLLLQPPASLPSVVIIDEPELGLHPSAISSLAGMAKAASKHCQVIMATQSPRLVDEFAADEIVIVEWNDEQNSSEFSRLDENQLSDWLERYSLSELWEKNVLGGQP